MYKKKHIIFKFEFELCWKIITNKFLFIVDVVDFVTVVLVSKSAMMLIKQNIKMFDEIIRKILHDGARLGEILNDVNF